MKQNSIHVIVTLVIFIFITLISFQEKILADDVDLFEAKLTGIQLNSKTRFFNSDDVSIPFDGDSFSDPGAGPEIDFSRIKNIKVLDYDEDYYDYEEEVSNAEKPPVYPRYLPNELLDDELKYIQTHVLYSDYIDYLYGAESYLVEIPLTRGDGHSLIKSVDGYNKCHADAKFCIAKSLNQGQEFYKECRKKQKVCIAQNLEMKCLNKLSKDIDRFTGGSRLLPVDMILPALSSDRIPVTNRKMFSNIPSCYVDTDDYLRIAIIPNSWLYPSSEYSECGDFYAYFEAIENGEMECSGLMFDHIYLYP
ncbi:MAG: hypothetical protein ABIA04_10180 [Pseudomonadota bacterium]